MGGTDGIQRRAINPALATGIIAVRGFAVKANSQLVASLALSERNLKQAIEFAHRGDRGPTFIRASGDLIECDNPVLVDRLADQEASEGGVAGLGESHGGLDGFARANGALKGEQGEPGVGQVAGRERVAWLAFLAVGDHARAEVEARGAADHTVRDAGE